MPTSLLILKMSGSQHGASSQHLALKQKTPPPELGFLPELEVATQTGPNITRVAVLAIGNKRKR